VFGDVNTLRNIGPRRLRLTEERRKRPNPLQKNMKNETLQILPELN
jgi:hypothetical protein